MFVLSLKMSKIKLILGFSIILILTIITTNFLTNSEITETRTKASKEIILKTLEQKIDYIQQLGWEISQEPTEIVEIVIPKEFTDVYTNYNKIQIENGYNLENYKGKVAKKWTFNVTNFPESSEKVRCNLIISDNKLIGGDISSVAFDGFMTGLIKKQ